MLSTYPDDQKKSMICKVKMFFDCRPVSKATLLFPFRLAPFEEIE